MCDLPSQLTSLRWLRTCIGPTFLTHQHLNHLTTLDLSQCFIEWEDYIISQLPRGLSTLELGLCNNITGKCFEQIPRGLTYLNMAHVSNVRDEDIKHLPRKITHLDLTTASELTNLCLKDLPSGLLFLQILGSSLLTADGYNDLPDPLRGPCGIFRLRMRAALWDYNRVKEDRLNQLWHLYEKIRLRK